MRRIVITGSSGMLGCALSRELGGDYQVYGMDVVQSKDLGDRQRTACPGRNEQQAGACSVNCDITDRKRTVDAISKIKPDIVIHAAAWTDVDGCELDPGKAYKVNSAGTENIALASRKAGATVVYISTDFVFDGRKKRPYKETDKPNPLSVYGDSKLKGEEAVKKISENHFILRTSWLYGAGGKNFVDTILAKAEDEKILRVVDDQLGSPTYTKDLAEAIHALLDAYSAQRTAYSAPRYGIYHVSNIGSVSWYEYTKIIIKMKKAAVKARPISSEELARPAKRPAMSVLDNSKFVKFTGYRMRRWQDALKDYLDTQKERTRC
jgi:dTDP-4-dehydrorhamnose reductase